MRSFFGSDQKALTLHWAFFVEKILHFRKFRRKVEGESQIRIIEVQPRYIYRFQTGVHS